MEFPRQDALRVTSHSQSSGLGGPAARRCLRNGLRPGVAELFQEFNGDLSFTLKDNVPIFICSCDSWHVELPLTSNAVNQSLRLLLPRSFLVFSFVSSHIFPVFSLVFLAISPTSSSFQIANFFFSQSSIWWNSLRLLNFYTLP